MSTVPTEAVAFPPSRGAEHRLGAELARWASAAIIGLLWLAALLLVWRRLAGALSTPLDLPSIVSLAAVAAGMAVVARLLARRDHRRRHAFAEVAISSPLVLLAAAASLPGTPLAGWILLWAAVVAEEAWAWRAGARRMRPEPVPQQPRPSDPPPENAAEADADEPMDEECEEEIPSGEVLQQITRSRLACGGEVLSGWLRIPLAAGQRSANVHLAFCPPFPQTPQVMVDQRDGPSARIRPIQILPYGARFDLKLAHSCTNDTALVLHFVAESAPGGDQAAMPATGGKAGAGAARPDSP